MGFKFAANLYCGCSAQRVVEVLHDFYRSNAHRSREIYRNMYGPYLGPEFPGERLQIYDYPPRWCVVDIFMEPEDWIRERHLHVSRQLACPGFFLFEYDGDYWGYEFFDKGEIVDRFTNDAGQHWYFEGMDCSGHAEILAARLPFLAIEDISPYLDRLPDYEEFEAERDKMVRELDVPPRPGDQYSRWAEASSLNFLRMLGVPCGFSGYGGYFEYGVPMLAEMTIPVFPQRGATPE
jgi:hypothetical protein